MRIFTQQLVAPGVEGLDRRGGVPIRHKAVDASLHLLRGAVGECQRKDLLRECVLFCNKPRDASCDHLRLPRASAGDH